MEDKIEINRDLLSVYETAILMFGIIPILKILKIAELNENFAECEVIVKAVADLNRMTGGTMPTKIEDVEIDKIKKAFDVYGGSNSGEDYFRRLREYQREARKFIDDGKLLINKTKN